MSRTRLPVLPSATLLDQSQLTLLPRTTSAFSCAQKSTQKRASFRNGRSLLLVVVLTLVTLGTLSARTCSRAGNRMVSFLFSNYVVVWSLLINLRTLAVVISLTSDLLSEERLFSLLGNLWY